MKVVAYLTHPLGPNVNGSDAIRRADNINNTLDWVRWFIQNTHWAICANWLTHLMAVDEEVHRPRTLVDQTAMMVRCDVLIMCGGETSPHMRVEHQFAKNRGIAIVDATVLGRLTPRRGTKPPVGNSWMAWFQQIATGPIVPMVAR